MLFLVVADVRPKFDDSPNYLGREALEAPEAICHPASRAPPSVVLDRRRRSAAACATSDPHLKKFVGLRCCRDRATRRPYTIHIGHQNAGFRGLTHAAMYEPARETLRRGFLGSLAARAAHLKRLPTDVVLPTAVHAEPPR